KDVLHDFAVAQFRVKMDLVPGMVTYLWFEPTVVGSYEVLCEELCGIAHHTMRGSVVVEEQADFDAWLAEQPTFADTQGAVAGNAVVGAAQYAVCAACHGQQGAIDNVIAHIQTFPDNPSPQTIDGDVSKGQRIYNVCAYCHGKDAEGIQAINAPRMAGMTDWYLASQLKNFNAGIRGEHPQDFYGKQMGFMGRTLHDEKAVNDVVAYINTL
ncbi:MAG: c-type cytochrome, partial [Woeseiales bacterium]